MNIRQIEAFRATMRTGSITAAAKVMHITQPSVSRLVADLQEYLGFELFVRSGRGLVATVEARRFYQGVESLFAGTEKLQALADTIRTTSGGVVTIGTIQTLAAPVVAEVLSDFHQTHPQVRTMSYVRNTPGIVDAVQMQQFDLGLVGRAPPYEGVEVLYETDLPYVCLIPAGHALAQEDGAVDLEVLAEREDFVTFGGAYPDEMLHIDHQLSQKLVRDSRLAAANMLMVVALARKAGMLAIVDELSAREAARQGDMVYRPVCQALSFHIALVTRGVDTLSTEARAVADGVIGVLSGFAT